MVERSTCRYKKVTISLQKKIESPGSSSTSSTAATKRVFPFSLAIPSACPAPPLPETSHGPSLGTSTGGAVASSMCLPSPLLRRLALPLPKERSLVFTSNAELCTELMTLSVTELVGEEECTPLAPILANQRARQRTMQPRRCQVRSTGVSAGKLFWEQLFT